MEFYADPAALGGVVIGLMLAAWLLGRWHGEAADRCGTGEPIAEPPAVPSDRVPRHAPARPCQQAAREERRAVLEAAAALGEIHADVSAYRRAQQVLADGAFAGTIRAGLSASGEGEACRYLGISGQPTCPLPGIGGTAGGAPCACGGCALAVPRPVQPVALVRV